MSSFEALSQNESLEVIEFLCFCVQLSTLIRNKQKGPISPQDFKDGELFQEW